MWLLAYLWKDLDAVSNRLFENSAIAWKSIFFCEHFFPLQADSQSLQSRISLTKRVAQTVVMLRQPVINMDNIQKKSTPVLLTASNYLFMQNVYNDILTAFSKNQVSLGSLTANEDPLSWQTHYQVER